MTMVVLVAAEVDGDMGVYRIREIFLYCFVGAGAGQYDINIEHELL